MRSCCLSKAPKLASTTKDRFVTTSKLVCAELQKRFPVRFTSEAHLPPFRHSDGKMLAREEVGGIAKLAAIAVGNDPKETDPHSFRSTGASALMNAKVEYPVVQRFGRWSTDAAHGYIWEALDVI